jgi:hypothetical protein
VVIEIENHEAIANGALDFVLATPKLVVAWANVTDFYRSKPQQQQEQQEASQ